MKFPQNTLMWLVPTRYWENTEPEPVTLSTELDTIRDKTVQVWHKGYTATVLASVDRLFWHQECASEMISLLCQIRLLTIRDRTEWQEPESTGTDEA